MYIYIYLFSMQRTLQIHLLQLFFLFCLYHVCYMLYMSELKTMYSTMYTFEVNFVLFWLLTNHVQSAYQQLSHRVARVKGKHAITLEEHLTMYPNSKTLYCELRKYPFILVLHQNLIHWLGWFYFWKGSIPIRKLAKLETLRNAMYYQPATKVLL